ncbi:MAG: putative lipid II flippase FtsW [Candidatus Omnitrophica bacterium]|nr:putative lipid II flippase FtsW [Candidatus Omnitrophota bacterium]
MQIFERGKEMRDIRTILACITFMLLMFGVVMVYSASAIYATQIYGDGMYFLKRHVMILIVGLIASLMVLAVDIEIIRKYSKHILAITFILLVAVLVPGIGRSAGGAKRWLDIGFFNVQPSEIAKLAFLVYLADFVSAKETRIDHFLRGFLPPLVVLGVFMGLIVMEPDLGTTIAIGVLGLLILYISGANSKYLIASILASLPLVYYLMFNKPYRRKRMLAFLNPWKDEQGIGFQIVQSFLALGSGGLFGVGLGESKQKLLFLPAAHTDFIFSIIGEELGFIGAFSLLCLFFALIWMGAMAAFRVNDLFRKTLIFGIVFMIAFEVIVNIGVVSGILPTKGLPLPFVSYGGTSLVIHMVAIALLLNATRESGI